MRNKSRLTRIYSNLRILGIVLGVGFLIYQIITALQDFNWAILSPKDSINIFLALGINVLTIIPMMLAWKVILDGMEHPLSIISVFTGFNLSFVARYIPGTVWGYLARNEWLKREHDISYGITNISSIIEIIGTVFTCLFVIIQGLLFGKKFGFSFLFVIAFLLGSWALLNILLLFKPIRKLFRLEETSILRFSFIKWFIIFLLFISVWYSFGASLTIFASIIDVSLTAQQILEMSSIFALAWFIGFIVPFMPSGLGLREYFLTVLLMAQFNLIKADASFIAIGFRVLVSAAELLWILFGLTNKTLIGIGRVRSKIQR